MSRLRPALRLRSIALWMTATAVVPVSLVLDDPLDTWRQGPPEDAMTLVGHEVLGVERRTCPARSIEAWGHDIGLHLVSVIAGTLTGPQRRSNTGFFCPGRRLRRRLDAVPGRERRPGTRGSRGYPARPAPLTDSGPVLGRFSAGGEDQSNYS
jgi:hypothetical protein